MRYLTEINENTSEVPEELLANSEIKKALDQLHESAFTEAQLLGYEKFWDIVSVERTLFSSGKREGHAEGLAEGLEKGLAEGEHKKQLEIARKLKSKGLPLEIISETTGLSVQDIEEL